MRITKVDHNEAWVKTVTLDQFKAHNEHLKDLTDLDADYERIVGKKKSEKKETSK